MINELRNEGCGIVYISHRLKEIFEICDDITVLRDGKFIAQRKVSETDEDSLIELMVGRRLDEQYPRIESKHGTTCLEVKNLSSADINNVSFTLDHGEILGISGLMGAGRTELMKAIFGALKRDSGEIILDGKSIDPKSPQDALANGIAYISEDRKGDGLILGLSVKENISLPHLIDPAGRASGDLEKRIQTLLESVGLDGKANKRPGELSHGERQRVAVCRAMLNHPQLLLADEPTGNLDQANKQNVVELLIRQAKEHDSMLLMVTHDHSMLEAFERVIDFSQLVNLLPQTREQIA